MPASSTSRYSLKRFFLFRRRLDGPLFALAAATFLLPTDTSAVLFGVFLVIGIYLLIVRPRKSMRRLDRAYVLAALIFASGCLATNLLNGSLPEDMRWSSYPLYYLFVVPLAAGTVLVRDPLRMFVLGTRAGLAVVFLWAVADVSLAIWGGIDIRAGALRFGLGSNAANAAFAIAFLAVVSRLDVKSPPAMLGSRRLFFYLAFITVLASQTRAVLPVFALGMMIDLFALARNGLSGGWPPTRRNATAWMALLAICAGSFWVLYPVVSQRVQTTLNEISVTMDGSQSSSTSGIATRFVQWQAALRLIAEKPVLGRGGHGISDAIAGQSAEHNRDDLKRYTFVHNFLLDEALQRGLVGLTLTLGFFGFSLHRIYSRGGPDLKENVVLIVGLTLCFGLLHYLLVIDRHVLLYALYFLLLTSANRGWRAPRDAH